VRAPWQPGGLLLHPVCLGALALWAVNDHVFKSAWPGVWTGKLSDVASLAAFPLLVVALGELGAARAGWRWWRSGPLLYSALVATGLVMATINVWPDAAWLYRHGLGLAQWPGRALVSLLSGTGWPAVGTVGLTMDPTDLWTLPALAVPWWIHRATHRP